jgi:hypothetical protein
MIEVQPLKQLLKLVAYSQSSNSDAGRADNDSQPEKQVANLSAFMQFLNKFSGRDEIDLQF